jgi:hypothetical protein
MRKRYWLKWATRGALVNMALYVSLLLIERHAMLRCPNIIGEVGSPSFDCSAGFLYSFNSYLGNAITRVVPYNQWAYLATIWIGLAFQSLVPGIVIGTLTGVLFAKAKATTVSH